MTENYYYIQTEHNPDLFTVGFGEGKNWYPDSDHNTREAAAARVRFLNGGDDSEDLRAELEALRDEVRELKALNLRIWQAFSCADATIRHRYAEDRRGETSRYEADALLEYVAGYKVTP